jgi:hypothetical protein
MMTRKSAQTPNTSGPRIGGQHQAPEPQERLDGQPGDPVGGKATHPIGKATTLAEIVSAGRFTSRDFVPILEQSIAKLRG